MNKTLKRALAVILLLVMTLGLLPGAEVSARASAGEKQGTGSVRQTVAEAKPIRLRSANVTLDRKVFTYNGAAHEPLPTVRVTIDGKDVKLKKDADYTVIYRKNVNAGQARMIVTGIGAYTGTVTRAFTIEPKELTAEDVTLSKTSYVFSGKEKKPTAYVRVQLKDGTVKLTKKTGYTAVYENNLDIGKAKVTVTGKGNYTGTVVKTFEILPKGTTVTGVKSGAGKLTVSWKAQKTQTQGYQIEVSDSPDFAGKNTYVQVKKNTVTKKEITGLTPGTVWYVRIRTFARVDGKRYNSAWSAAKSVKLPHVPPTGDEKYVALTFDDGPDMRYTSSTGRILDTLDKYGARATFFVLASQVDSSIVGSYFASRNTELVRRAHDLGMEIGSHTYNHKNLNRLSSSEIARELNNSCAKIEAITGEKVRLVRPPYGNANQTVRDTIDKPMINWSIDTLDWDSKNPDKIYSKVMSNIKPGSIILMHDIYGTTADAVERVVPALIERGYTIVTVSELYELYGMELKPHTVYYAPWYDR